jgi:hypothetical protein
MATVRKDFDSYKVWCYSGFQYEALVHCWKGGIPAGEIVFFKDDSPIPSNESSSNGLPSIRYPLSRFNDIISILRYEKPFYLFLNLDTLVGIVGTAEQEPVGEEES